MFVLNVLHHRRTHYIHIKSHENRQIQNFLKLCVLVPSVLVWKYGETILKITQKFLCIIISIVVV